jgi:hypothetical protein
VCRETHTRKNEQRMEGKKVKCPLRNRTEVHELAQDRLCSRALVLVIKIRVLPPDSEMNITDTGVSDNLSRH